MLGLQVSGGRNGGVCSGAVAMCEIFLVRWWRSWRARRSIARSAAQIGFGIINAFEEHDLHVKAARVALEDPNGDPELKKLWKW